MIKKCVLVAVDYIDSANLLVKPITFVKKNCGRKASKLVCNLNEKLCDINKKQLSFYMIVVNQ